jgi:potassium-dependent mechanosensitive channel
VGWARLQWLAAAFTFGLAFGLQEIFANFVSGLIILVERPVRVGDVVTVAGIEGRVTRLQMRSTTIQDWERREFLVPNKEFITGSLLNWTLSDPVSRVVIKVGVAYGSDVKLAEKLLLETARDNKHVLTESCGPSRRALPTSRSTLPSERRGSRLRSRSVTCTFAADSRLSVARDPIQPPPLQRRKRGRICPCASASS